MKLFVEIPNNLALRASKKILDIKARDLVDRFVEVFDLEAGLASYMHALPGTRDTPKLRHWLAVARSMVRSRLKGFDPEPQFIAHFIVDSLAADRLAQLHALRALELLIDDAIEEKRKLVIDLQNIIAPPKFHVWGLGTLSPTGQHLGVQLQVDGEGNFSGQFGELAFTAASLSDVGGEGYYLADKQVQTTAGRAILASNIQGLGDAYHSNAPVVRGATALAEWAPVLQRAVDKLASLDKAVARDCLELSKAICPLHCGGTSFGSSSPADVIGLVFLPGVVDHLDVMECLLHESLHQKLYHAEEGAPLFAGENGDEEIYYSPWRPDGRPLRMLVHGSYVFTGVAQMWRAIAETAANDQQRDEALFQVHYRSGQARRALAVVEKYGALTAFGETVVSIIAEGADQSRDGLRFPNYYAGESEKRQQAHFEAHSIFVH
jgi:HEXXH motif-containing protein